MAEILPKDWSNWKWQLKNRFKSAEEIKSILNSDEKSLNWIQSAIDRFPFSLTPYLLSLMDPMDSNCPIRKQFLPNPSEIVGTPWERLDPLEEEKNSPVRGLTHRYPDRAIWYLTHLCASYCRFCTRKRKVGSSHMTPIDKDRSNALDYIQKNPGIREIILSGGDPLLLSDILLEKMLWELRQIPHINHIRIHTRILSSLPFRITEKLCRIFKKNFPIYIVTHFNHPKELSSDSATAVRRLIQTGNVILLNQSVLLRGVNNQSEILSELQYRLLQIGIKPYYLHQCDEVFGNTEFRVPIEEGLQIMQKIRGHQSGIGVPTYVQDLTGGGGKVPLYSKSHLRENDGNYEFENFKGKTFKVKKIQ